MNGVEFDEEPMMEMDLAMACDHATYLLGEVQAYTSADVEGKKKMEDEWSQSIEDAIKSLWTDGATSTTTFAAAVASVVALLSF